ncbi:MAG TPA: hypothetical protein VGA08_01805, partial [Candidatus Saccharimonadales bacterium]
ALIPGRLGGQANAPIGLSVVPAISDTVVAGGQLTVKDITITNIADIALPVTVDFRALAPVDPISDEALRRRYDASAWITADQTELVLAPGESQTIQIRITPPVDAGPGGHYASVIFRAINSPQGGDSQTVASPEVASLLFLTVPGNITEQASIAYRSTGLISRRQDRSFGLEFTNQGNVHLLPTATVSLRQLSGHEVDRLTFTPKLVIPGTRASLTTTWRPTQPGIYRAVFNISYGSPSRSEEHTSGMIIVWPAVWIMVVLAAGLGVALRTGWSYLRRLTRRRRIKLSKDDTEPARLTTKADRLDDVVRSRELRDKSRRR